MPDTAELVNNYIAMWNEPDPYRRRALITQTVTAEATYIDPLMAGDGIDGIDAMIAGAQST